MPYIMTQRNGGVTVVTGFRLTDPHTSAPMRVVTICVAMLSLRAQISAPTRVAQAEASTCVTVHTSAPMRVARMALSVCAAAHTSAPIRVTRRRFAAGPVWNGAAALKRRGTPAGALVGTPTQFMLSKMNCWMVKFVGFVLTEN